MYSLVHSIWRNYLTLSRKAPVPLHYRSGIFQLMSYLCSSMFLDVPHQCFNFQLPNSILDWAYFYVLVCHLYVFMVRCMVKPVDHFFLHWLFNLESSLLCIFKIIMFHWIYFTVCSLCSFSCIIFTQCYKAGLIIHIKI